MKTLRKTVCKVIEKKICEKFKYSKEINVDSLPKNKTTHFYNQENMYSSKNPLKIFKNLPKSMQ